MTKSVALKKGRNHNPDVCYYYPSCQCFEDCGGLWERATMCIQFKQKLTTFPEHEVFICKKTEAKKPLTDHVVKQLQLQEGINTEQNLSTELLNHSL